MIAAGILRKWSSSKGLSKARLADTQRYTRKVRTCEKDLAKAKENLEKWRQPESCSLTSANISGTVQTSLGAATKQPQTGAPTPTAQSIPGTATNAPAEGNEAARSHQDKGDMICVHRYYCRVYLIFLDYRL